MTHILQKAFSKHALGVELSASNFFHKFLNVSIAHLAESIFQTRSGAELLSSLDKLGKEDVLYIHTLGQTLAYRVDQIKKVEPENSRGLEIVPGKDLVTLVTCTPYGINSHRLLVRGTRIPYAPEMQEASAGTPIAEKGPSDAMVRQLLIIGGIVLATAVVVLAAAIYTHHLKKQKQRNAGKDDES